MPVFEQPRCPECGCLLTGTVEHLTGLAELEEVRDGILEYTGYTRIDWHGQKTVRRGLQYLVQCENGHQWWSGMTACLSESSPNRRIKPCPD